MFPFERWKVKITTSILEWLFFVANLKCDIEKNNKSIVVLYY